MTRLRSFVTIGSIVLLATCGENGTGPTLIPGPPAALQIVSGDLQADTVGKQLPEALVVRVVDSAGIPIEGQVVNFRVTSGGGSVFAGVGLTDSTGQARELWTLGTVARDTQTVEVRAVDPQTGTPLVFGTFKAIGVPDAPQAALDRVLTERPGIGAAYLFPSPKDRSQAVTYERVRTWLYKAEKLAELPKRQGSLFHSFRRKWATERKHLSPADVARAGGWSTTVTLQRCYQQPDEETMLRVVLGAGELREKQA